MATHCWWPPTYIIGFLPDFALCFDLRYLRSRKTSWAPSFAHSFGSRKSRIMDERIDAIQPKALKNPSEIAGRPGLYCTTINRVDHSLLFLVVRPHYFLLEHVYISSTTPAMRQCSSWEVSWRDCAGEGREHIAASLGLPNRSHWKLYKSLTMWQGWGEGMTRLIVL